MNFKIFAKTAPRDFNFYLPNFCKKPLRIQHGHLHFVLNIDHTSHKTSSDHLHGPLLTQLAVQDLYPDAVL